MPPPRLPRHLRPCHPSGTAYQVRCAHGTTHVRPSTAGDESPQTTTTNSHDAAKKSWWSAALSRIAPWNRQTSFTESPQQPQPPSQPQPQDIPTVDSSEAKKDVSGEQTSETGAERIRRTTESPANRQRRILRSEARTRGKEAHKTESRDQDVVPVRKYITSSERPLHQPVVPRKVSSLAATPDRSDHVREQQTTIHKVQRKQTPTAISERDAATSSRNDDTTVIRQQLQGLFEQVKALQVALEAKIAVGQQPSPTSQENDTLTVEHTLPRDTKRHPTPIQSLLTDTSMTRDPVSFRRPETSFPKTRSGTLRYSQRAFRDSACTLGKVATELEAMQSPGVASVARHLRNRLRVLNEDAKLESDGKLRAVLGAHYKNWDLLHAEARYSPVVIHRPDLLLKLQVIDIRSKSYSIWKYVMHLKKELSIISPRVPRAPRMLVSHTDETHMRARDHNGDTNKIQNGTASSSLEKKSDGERLTRQIHTQSRSMKSSKDLNITTEDTGQRSTIVERSLRTSDETPRSSGVVSESSTTTTTTTANMSPKPTQGTSEPSEQSLLEELFPEASSTPQPRQPEPSERYPKLNLPDSTPIVRREFSDRTPSFKERVVESLQKQGEQVTVLQLTNCSTELTEADFRRIIPKSKHIEGWHRDEDLYKVVPGRDPLSLERLPFYYLLFKNAEAALAYQRNASRLHKLSALHRPANIFSAIPPPKGFLEEGEDITAAISSYNLLPTHHPMSLNVLMQPYNPALRNLIERGGYQPIAPSVDDKGNHIWKVLMHIEGYEPTPSDLFKIFSRDAYKHGMILPLRHESQTSIHRLRDTINLKMSSKTISSSRPRAYGTFDQSTSESEMTYDDPAIQSMLGGVDEDSPSQQNQLVMNRVYNRWVLDFEDEDTARRWSVRWHRRMLPELSHTKGAWKDSEEARICNTELLW